MNSRLFRKILLTIAYLGSMQPALAQISNPGFEAVEGIGGWHTSYGDWNLDPALVVSAEQGIAPRSGVGMLKFVGTDPNIAGFGAGADSAVSQLFDLRPYSEQIADGVLRLDLSGYFNRIPGTPSTDTQFGVYLRAHSGSPVNFQANFGNPIATVISTLFTDESPATWQVSSISLLVPQGTTYAEIGILAQENIDSTDTPPFHGHYADDISFVASVPEVGTLQMLFLGSAFLLFLRRSNRCH